MQHYILYIAMCIHYIYILRYYEDVADDDAIGFIGQRAEQCSISAVI